MKVKVDLSGIKENLKRNIKIAKTDKALLNDIGETIVTNSVASSRLGKDPKTGRNYPGFSGDNPRAYETTRERIARRNKAGPNFRPGRSNLTITGQLLNSIKHEVDGSKIIIKATGDRKPYYKGGSAPSNEDLANWHTTGAGKYPARRVIGISPKVMRIIQNKVVSFLRRSIFKFKR